MMMKSAGTLVAMVTVGVLSLIRGAQAIGPGGVITVKFERFSNLRALKYDARRMRTSCCDKGLFRCISACDPYFELCLKMTQGAQACAQTFRTKTFRNKKKIDFADDEVLKTRGKLFHRSTTHRNPLKFAFFRWQGFFNLRIVIKDQDFPSRDDFMDSFLIQKTLTPSPGAGSARWYTFSARGKTSQLRISYKVQCNRDYYGPECATRCLPRNDPKGHYSCDWATGLKMCLAGWLGPSCQVPCVPRDDDVTGHYTCHAITGSKVCRQGWYGANCTVYCREGIGSICDRHGNKFCLPNWYGTDCSKLCVPSGNFACNSITGEKKCTSGWYGKQCDVHCVATHDPSASYNCSPTGQKICHKDWYGANCDQYCTPTRDSVCNNVTGVRICNKGWHGPTCDTFCEPKNDQNAAYSCDPNGNKLCYPHWYGDSCTAFCIPSKNQRYVCNKNTGAKDCAQGWSGDNCDKRVPCVPRDDHDAGFTCGGDGRRMCLPHWYPEGRCNVYCKQPSPAYSCNERTGEKICRTGWYPMTGCDVYCLARDDLNAAYTCDPITGQKSCRYGWYGPHCDCAPTDDLTAGYTCNKNTGARVCLPGWTGSRCDMPDI